MRMENQAAKPRTEVGSTTIESVAIEKYYSE